MEAAGFINLLRTILILIVVYYAFKFIARLVFPMLFKKVMSNVEKKFNEQQHRESAHQEHTKEGETIIDKSPNASKKSNTTVGEYVDYEDVE